LVFLHVFVRKRKGNHGYASQNVHQNDLKLLDALKETFQIALKAKDETLELQKEVIAGLRKGM
jgi:hypothetical protein